MKLKDALDRTVRCYPDQPALVTDDGRSFTYAELDRRATRLANALAERVGTDRCATLSVNTVAAIESMLAGNKRGAATVQLSYRATVEELVRMAETAGATAIVFDDRNADAALKLLDRDVFEVAIHAGDREIDRHGVESYAAVLDGADPELEPTLPADDECAVLYTSGTTSVPKAVPFDQEELWYGAIQGIMEHGTDETDIALCTSPWYHMVTTDAWLYPHFVAGATVVLHPTFDPEEALELVERHDVTGVLAVPTQLRALNGVQKAAETPYDTDSLQYIRTGGAIVTEDLIEETNEYLCDQVYNTYGMTEAGADLTFAHPSAQDEHPGTIGKEAFAWELRVVESPGLSQTPDPEATVNAGERGEIIARGPGMSDGYIDNDEAEKKSYFDGWLRTRDIAETDDDGFLYIVDRVDNMIVSGGENIYPASVERVLGTHPDVAETCVFGCDDEEWGQVVTAVVVTEPGAELTDDDLDDYCRQHDGLAEFKRPRVYALTDEPLPRSDTGTVLREQLVETHVS
ncbi:long-chain-fatty-acid--CoA ligase [Halobellus salinus]|uniref:Long-chain-fatty-acid--CoA ligase n=1 Tax=Halobellus salinus TaxID=931585 RepID=A0A830EMI1_9EURY|nr:AMP-binding protein [Halobellus salinus]GGJ03402.1 long-chain-fatty-acid--CoA ligase [Halobellus salinus]SMP21413.1 fatty-acyl-CoA synthase [Halobellus salinus]